MDIKFRKMDLSDIPYVYKEELKIFGKSLGEKTLYNEVLYNDMSRYFLALVDGVRAGYVGAWLTIPNAEILNLFVSDKFRGNKIGKGLMNEVINICLEENIKAITLEVRKGNEHAISMYKDIGFVVSHVRKQYYENKEDAYLMILDLEVKV